MHEYHIDTIHSFYSLELKISIKRTSTSLFIMIGQYEAVFEQYSFSPKCWFVPGGKSILLPKREGYSRMVCVFVSREFNMSLKLSIN